MTPADGRARVAAIGQRKSRDGDWDDESAHAEEDALYRDVLRAIADGTAVDPTECARIAAETALLDFARWTS